METVSTKVPAPMKEQLDEMAEEIGESRSIVIRSLLRDAMEKEEENQESGEGEDGPPVAIFFSFIGWIIAAAAFLDAPTSVGYLGLGMVAFGIVFEKVGEKLT